MNAPLRKLIVDRLSGGYWGFVGMLLEFLAFKTAWNCRAFDWELGFGFLLGGLVLASGIGLYLGKRWARFGLVVCLPLVGLVVTGWFTFFFFKGTQHILACLCLGILATAIATWFYLLFSLKDINGA
jgi:hypothetical protein